MFNLNKITINSINVVWLYKNNTKKHYIHNGTLKHYELAYNLSGNEIINFNHKSYIIKPDTVLFLPTEIPDANYECELFGFDNEKIIISFAADSTMPKEAFTLEINNNSKLKSLFIKSNNYWNSGEQTIEAYYKCMALLYQIFAEISQLTHQYNPQFSKLTPAIKYLDENFRNPEFDIENLASLCGLSYAHFKRLFVQQFSIPPKKYLISKRMEFARALILNQQFSITEIAEMAGYENVYYFSNAYKKHYGCSPQHTQ